MILRYIAILVIFAVLVAGLYWLARRSSDAKSPGKPDTKEHEPKQ